MKKLVGSVFLLILIYSSARAQSDTQIKFFAQPGFTYSHNSDQKSGSPYFRSGQFIVYVTSQLTDRVSIAGELNAHYEALENGPNTEIERIYLRYLINDNLALRIGKTYNPIGFWNLNYNLGLVLQPSINRPLILQPTHDGGFTQARDVGIMLEGENLGSARFFFRAFLANGRGKNGGQQGTAYLLGKTMSSTVQLGIEPAEGLKISVSGIFNPLEKGQLTDFGLPLPEKATYSAIAGSISYFNTDKKLELISEFYRHNNKFSTLGSFHTDGAVVYLGLRTQGKITPYFYGEYLKFDDGDPFYPTTNDHTGQLFGDVTSYNLGFRYRFTPTIIFKMEAGVTDQEYYGNSINAKTQLAFSF